MVRKIRSIKDLEAKILKTRDLGGIILLPGGRVFPIIARGCGFGRKLRCHNTADISVDNGCLTFLAASEKI